MTLVLQPQISTVHANRVCVSWTLSLLSSAWGFQPGKPGAVPVGFRASHRVSALKLDHKTKEAQRMAKFFSLLFKPFPPLGSHSVSYALFTPLLFLTADIKSNEKVGAHISISRGDAGAIRARQQLRPAPSIWRGSASVAAPVRAAAR